jgi:ABC-type branched-subunit amino acid transport system substrate-binding protein
MTRSSVGLMAVATTAALVVGVTGCGRSSSSSNTPASGTSNGPSSAAPATSAAAGKGDFGDLKAICGPGTATGGSGRGISATSIKVGTMADPGASVAPGLGGDFFDVSTSFVKWCNDAGGINGRKIELTKYDAKYFNVAQQMLDACQTEFMLVGNGNPADAPGVKPRLACKLGEIPGYSVSPEAVASGLQVQATPNPANQFQIGPYRLLQMAYPDVTKLSIGSSNIASLRAQGLRTRDAVEKVGFKVADYSERPPLVSNYRPYMEAIKQSGATGYNDTTAVDITPELTAIKDTGVNLKWWMLGNQFYDPKTIKAVQNSGTPTKIYQYFSHLPFELADQFPVVKQMKDIMTAGVSSPKYTDFTALGFNAWVLWAKSATACGNNLTQDCVLQKAGSEKAWTAGGFFPARNTDPANPLQTTCYVMMDVTPQGFVYDKAITRPNNSIYNCDPKNVVDLQKTYQ